LVGQAHAITCVDRTNGENASLLARLHQAQGQLYAGGDDTVVREVLEPNIVWHVPGDNAIAGDYHGIAEVGSGSFSRSRVTGNSAQPPWLGRRT
jgi:hypothetical protein